MHEYDSTTPFVLALAVTGLRETIPNCAKSLAVIAKLLVGPKPFERSPCVRRLIGGQGPRSVG
jgi:hypothetical protein